MGALEAFLGAAIAGFGSLLLAVALLAWRRAADPKMAVLAGAFAAQAVGGALILLGEILGGPVQGSVPLFFAASTLASLVLLYAALFAPRK